MTDENVVETAPRKPRGRVERPTVKPYVPPDPEARRRSDANPRSGATWGSAEPPGWQRMYDATGWVLRDMRLVATNGAHPQVLRNSIRYLQGLLNDQLARLDELESMSDNAEEAAQDFSGEGDADGQSQPEEPVGDGG